MTHQTRFSWFVGAAAAALFVATGAAATQQTADQVIEQHLTALGGRDALAKLTTRRSTGTATISTPNGDLSGPIEISYKAPNKTRAYIELDLSALGGSGTMAIEQKFDGTAGWALNSLQGNTPITGNQLDNMKNNAFPTPLMNYKALGATVTLQPGETIDGKSMVVLLFTPKAGSAVRMYFDPSTHLLSRTAAKVNTPDVGDLNQVTDVSDYRTVDGVKVPFHVVNSNEVQTVSIVLTNVEHNVALDDALFSVK